MAASFEFHEFIENYAVVVIEKCSPGLQDFTFSVRTNLIS